METSKALKSAREGHALIREILLNEWDPIGVSEFPEAADEYDSYVPEIYGLLVRRETVQKLVDYLWWLATEHMGLCGDRQRTQQIAERLISAFLGSKSSEGDA